MTTKQTLAERVKALRLLSGLTQKDLGARCQLTGGAIGMLETAERKTPSAGTLLKLAQGTGTTVEYLLTGVGAEPTEESVRVALERAQAQEAPAEPTATFHDQEPATGTDGAS